MFESISQIKKRDIASKTVLLRLDLNMEKGELSSSLRLARAWESIQELIKKDVRIVIVSHRGRPDSAKAAKDAIYRKYYSLAPIARELSKRLKRKIEFIPYTRIEGVSRRLEKKRRWGIAMVENIRFFPGEQKNSRSFAKSLATLGDVYVNDAFGVSHRAQASVDAITDFLPSYMGRGLSLEIKELKRVLSKSKKPLVLIVGGTKVSDKIGIIGAFQKRAAHILVGGGCGNAFLVARRIPIGSSVYEKEGVERAKEFLSSAHIHSPSDLVRRKDAIVDIGPVTALQFSNIIRGAGTIIWSGPMGLIEKKPYDKGTLEIAKAIASSRAFSVVGGGETTSFLLMRGLCKKISFCSTGGGAMLAFLSGEKLPGIEALKRSKIKIKK